MQEARSQQTELHDAFCNSAFDANSMATLVLLRQRCHFLRALKNPLTDEERARFPPNDQPVTDHRVLHWATRRYFLDQKKRLKLLFDEPIDEAQRQQRQREFGATTYSRLPFCVTHVLARILPIIRGFSDDDPDGQDTHANGTLTIPGLRDSRIDLNVIFQQYYLDQDRLRNAIDVAERICEFLMAPWMWRNGPPQDAFRCGIPLTRGAILQGYLDESVASQNQQVLRAFIASAESLPIDAVPVIEIASCNDAVQRLIATLQRNDAQLQRLVLVEHRNFFAYLCEVGGPKLASDGDLSDVSCMKSRVLQLFIAVFKHCTIPEEDVENQAHLCRVPPTWIEAFDSADLPLDDTQCLLATIEELLCTFSAAEINELFTCTEEDEGKYDMYSLSATSQGMKLSTAQRLMNLLFELLLIISDLRLGAMPASHWKSHVQDDAELNIVEVERGVSENQSVQCDYRKANLSFVTDIGLRMDGVYYLTNTQPPRDGQQRRKSMLRWLPQRAADEPQDARVAPLMEQLSQLCGRMIRLPFMEPPNLIQERELTFKVCSGPHGRVVFTDVMIDSSSRSVIPSDPVPVTVTDESIPFLRVCLFSSIPALRQSKMVLREKASIIALSLNFEARGAPEGKVPDAIRLHTSPEFKATFLKKTNAILNDTMKQSLQHVATQKMVIEKQDGTASIFVVTADEIRAVRSELRSIGYQIEHVSVDDQSFHHKAARLQELRQGIQLSFVLLDVLGELEASAFECLAKEVCHGSLRIIMKADAVTMGLVRNAPTWVSDKARDVGGCQRRVYKCTGQSAAPISQIVSSQLQDSVLRLIDVENTARIVREEFQFRCAWAEALSTAMITAKQEKTMCCVSIVASSLLLEKMIQRELAGARRWGDQTQAFTFLRLKTEVVKSARGGIYVADNSWTPRMKRRCIEAALEHRSLMVVFVTTTLWHHNVFLRPPVSEGRTAVEGLTMKVIYAEECCDDQEHPLPFIFGEKNMTGPHEEEVNDLITKALRNPQHVVHALLAHAREPKVTCVPFSFFARFLPLCEFVSQVSRIKLYLRVVWKIDSLQRPLEDSFDNVHGPVMRLLDVDRPLQLLREFHTPRYEAAIPDSNTQPVTFLLQQASEERELQWEELRDQWALGYPHTQDSLVMLLTVYHEPLRVLLAVGPLTAFQTFRTTDCRCTSWIAEVMRRMSCPAVQAHLRNTGFFSFLSAIKWSTILGRNGPSPGFDSSRHACQFDQRDLDAIVKPPLSISLELQVPDDDAGDAFENHHEVLTMLLGMDSDVIRNQVSVREYFCGRKHAMRNENSIWFLGGARKVRLGSSFVALLIEHGDTTDNKNYLTSHRSVVYLITRFRRETQATRQGLLEEFVNFDFNRELIKDLLCQMSIPALALLLSSCYHEQSVTAFMRCVLEINPPSIGIGKKGAQDGIAQLLSDTFETKSFQPGAVDTCVTALCYFLQSSPPREGFLSHPKFGEDMLPFERKLLMSEGNLLDQARHELTLQCHLNRSTLMRKRVCEVLRLKYSEVCKRQTGTVIEKLAVIFRPIDLSALLRELSQCDIELRSNPDQQFILGAIWLNDPLGDASVIPHADVTRKLYEFVKANSPLSRRIYSVVLENRASVSPYILGVCGLQEQLSMHTYNTLRATFDWPPLTMHTFLVTTQAANRSTSTAHSYRTCVIMRPLTRRTFDSLITAAARTVTRLDAPSNFADCTHDVGSGVDDDLIQRNLRALRLPGNDVEVVLFKLCIVLWFRSFGCSLQNIVDLPQDPAVRNELRALLLSQSKLSLFDSQRRIKNTFSISSVTFPRYIDSHYRHRSSACELYAAGEASKRFTRALLVSSLPTTSDGPAPGDDLLATMPLTQLHIGVAEQVALQALSLWAKLSAEERDTVLHPFAVCATSLAGNGQELRCKELVSKFCKTLRTAATAGDAWQIAEIVAIFLTTVGFTTRPSQVVLQAVCDEQAMCTSTIKKELEFLFSHPGSGDAVVPRKIQPLQISALVLPTQQQPSVTDERGSKAGRTREVPELLPGHPVFSEATDLVPNLQECVTALNESHQRAKTVAEAAVAPLLASRSVTRSRNDAPVVRQAVVDQFSDSSYRVAQEGGRVFDVSEILSLILPNGGDGGFFGELHLKSGFDFSMIELQNERMIKFCASLDAHANEPIVQSFQDSYEAWRYCIREPHPATLIGRGFFFVKSADNNWILHLNTFFPAPLAQKQPPTVKEGAHAAPIRVGNMWHIVAFHKLIGMKMSDEVLAAAKFVCRCLGARLHKVDAESDEKLMEVLQKFNADFDTASGRDATDTMNAVENLIIEVLCDAQEPKGPKRRVAVMETLCATVFARELQGEFAVHLGEIKAAMPTFLEGVCKVCSKMINKVVVDEFCRICAISRDIMPERARMAGRDQGPAAIVFTTRSETTIHEEFPLWVKEHNLARLQLANAGTTAESGLSQPEEVEAQRRLTRPAALKGSESRETVSILGGRPTDIGYGFCKFSSKDAGLVAYCMTNFVGEQNCRQVFGFQFLDRAIGSATLSKFNQVEGATIGYLYDVRTLNTESPSVVTASSGEDVDAAEEFRNWWLSVVSAPIPLDMKKWFAQQSIFASAESPDDDGGNHQKIAAFCLANRCPRKDRKAVMISALHYGDSIREICERVDHRYGVLACFPAPRHDWLDSVAVRVECDEALTAEEIFELVVGQFSTTVTHVIVSRPQQQRFALSDVVLKWMCEYTEQWPWRFVVLVNCLTHFNAPEIRDRIRNTIPLADAESSRTITKQFFIKTEGAQFWDAISAHQLKDSRFEELGREKRMTQQTRKWDGIIRRRIQSDSHCAILVITPPGAGKTYLMRNLVSKWPTFRVDCSDAILNSESMVEYLGRKLPHGNHGPSQGTFSILVADEYHMLPEVKKKELLQWLWPRLAWLKVVLIGNRRDDMDSRVVDQLKRFDLSTVEDITGRLDIKTASEQSSSTPLTRDLVRCMLCSLRALFSDESVSFRLVESLSRCVTPDESIEQQGVNAFVEKIRDKLIRYGASFPAFFVNYAVGYFHSMLKKTPEARKAAAISSFRNRLRGDGGHVIAEAVMLIPLTIDLVTVGQGPSCDSVLDFSEFCGFIAAHNAHPATRLTAWVLYLCACADVELNEDEKNRIFKAIRALRMTNQARFPIIGVATADLGEVDIESCDSICQEGDYSDLHWIHLALIHGHAISWELVGAKWSEVPVTDPAALERLLHDMAHDTELVLRQLDRRNLLMLLQRDGCPTLRRIVMDAYPADQLENEFFLHEAPWLFATWKSIVDQEVEEWEQAPTAMLERSVAILKKKLPSLMFGALKILAWISSFGGMLMTVLDNPHKRQQLLLRMLFAVTNEQFVSGNDEVTALVREIWRGTFGSCIAVARGTPPKLPHTLSPTDATVHKELNGIKLSIAVEIASSAAEVSSWPRIMKVVAKAGRDVLMLNETEELLPYLQFHALQFPGELSSLKRLVGAVAQTQEPGSLRFANDAGVAVLQLLAGLKVEILQEHVPMRDNTDCILQNFEHFINACKNENEIGLTGWVGDLLKMEYRRVHTVNP